MCAWLVWKSGSAGETCDSRTCIYQPQQSVLKPQSGQRQTACIRYISAPQRSQSVLSAGAGVESLSGVMARTGWRGVSSDIAGLSHGCLTGLLGRPTLRLSSREGC